MHTGQIKKWNAPRGFGFIAADDGVEYFAHITQASSRVAPAPGTRVSFSVAKGRDDRLMACGVEIVTDKPEPDAPAYGDASSAWERAANGD
jgi:cold shock CspA family protein